MFEKVWKFNYPEVTVTKIRQKNANIQERVTKDLRCLTAMNSILMSKKVLTTPKKKKNIFDNRQIHGGICMNVKRKKIHIKKKKKRWEQKVLRKIYEGKKRRKKMELKNKLRTKMLKCKTSCKLNYKKSATRIVGTRSQNKKKTSKTSSKTRSD